MFSLLPFLNSGFTMDSRGKCWETKQLENITRVCFAYLGLSRIIRPMAVTWHICDYCIISESTVVVAAILIKNFRSIQEFLVEV
jgi:hypothetical protein